MKNQVGSTRMDTALKMALIAFISLLAFSSGVYFGKQITESDYQLKALESDFNKNHPGDIAENDGMKSDDQIAEEEVNALSEKLVNNEKGEVEGQPAAGHGAESRSVASNNEHGDEHDEHAAPAAAAGHGAPAAKAAHGAPAAAAHGAPAADAGHAAPAAAGHGAPAAAGHGAPAAKSAAAGSKPDLSAATKAAQRVASNAAAEDSHAAPAAGHGAPAKVPVTERVPTSLPKTVGASQDVEFTVQVASYPTMEAAKDHANELVKKGFPAFPVEAAVNGKVWFRVSVGSFRSQRDATTYRAQLLKQTSLPSAIVQRITR